MGQIREFCVTEAGTPRTKWCPRRTKKSVFLGMVFGWGLSEVFGNRKLKKAVEALNHNQKLQASQIQELKGWAELHHKFLGIHQEAIQNLDERMSTLQFQVVDTRELLKTAFIDIDQAHDYASMSARINAAFQACAANVDYIYDLVSVMATRRITPREVPHVQLQSMLKQIQAKLTASSQLTLPEDPDKYVYRYYGLIKVTPFVFQDALVLMLSVPLIDTSTILETYMVHNLPALHPTLGAEFMYQLESNYFSITADQQFAALPSPTEVDLCRATVGYLCALSTALYPVQGLQWCLYALFTGNTTGVGHLCKVQTQVHYTPRAISLGGYLWAVVAGNPTRIDLHCVGNQSSINVNASLTIINVPNGCYAFCPLFKIPAKTELTAKIDIFNRSTYLTQLNYQFHDHFFEMPILRALSLAQTVTPSEKDLILGNIPKLPPLVPVFLDKELKRVDTNWAPSNWLLAGCVIAIVLVVVVMVVVLFCYVKHNKNKFTSLSSTLTTLSTGNLALPNLTRSKPKAEHSARWSATDPENVYVEPPLPPTAPERNKVRKGVSFQQRPDKENCNPGSNN